MLESRLCSTVIHNTKERSHVSPVYPCLLPEGHSRLQDRGGRWEQPSCLSLNCRGKNQSLGRPVRLWSMSQSTRKGEATETGRSGSVRNLEGDPLDLWLMPSVHTFWKFSETWERDTQGERLHRAWSPHSTKKSPVLLTARVERLITHRVLVGVLRMVTPS